jgi:dephospho-CoA kinase
MLRVGLTGGLASGKSFVAGELAALGCFVLHADQIGHQVQQEGAEAYDEIVREFGAGILRADRQIDRRLLAREVFANPDRLAQLNAIVHPRVRARTEQLLADFAAREPHGIAVVEAAILVEAGSYRGYDRLIVVVASEEQQIARAMARDQLSRAEALARIRRQMPLAEKVKYADYVIDASGSKEQTAAQTRAVYESLRGLTSGKTT